VSAAAPPATAESPATHAAAAAPTAAAGPTNAVATLPAPPQPTAAATAPQAAKAPPLRPDAKTRKLPTQAAAPAVAETKAPLPQGLVQIAISPWGQVEVNGAAVGTTPPLTRLELPQGTHTITVRNVDFPAYTQRVVVDPERPVTLKHRFGS
jgi:hypothetical protein